MNTVPINNYQPANFKSTYPVVHRVLYNGTYIPVSDFKSIKKMQGKLVRTLNSSMTKILATLDKAARENVSKWINSASLDGVHSQLKIPASEKEALAIFRGRMGYYDNDFCYVPEVRTVYNRQKGWLDGRYYLAYIGSGRDVKGIDNLAKTIGKSKHEAKDIDLEEAPELKDAIDAAVKDYNKRGLEYVTEASRRLTSKHDGMTYILQANFAPVLNKKGDVKDYRFISAKFVPEYTK
jgi:hypothetical protein